MKYIVDRFEEDFAVCETDSGEYININRNMLPKEVKAGDVLVKNPIEFIIDIEETKKRKESIKKLAEDLWE